jgi:hypothetical protein
VPALETPVDGLGIKAGCGSSPHGTPDRPYSRLDVLLNGDRLYTATGWGAESCDTLKQFAQTAGRIDA